MSKAEKCNMNFIGSPLTVNGSLVNLGPIHMTCSGKMQNRSCVLAVSLREFSFCGSQKRVAKCKDCKDGQSASQQETATF